MTSVADTLFKDFLGSVIADRVFSEDERRLGSGPLSDKQIKDISAGRSIEARIPFLMMVSGKGGHVDGKAFDSRKKFRNVTLLDHLCSVTRGAAVFAEIDLRGAGIHEETIPARVAGIMATAFLHDADKMLGMSRSDDLTAGHVSDLSARYGIDAFLARHGAQVTPQALLSRINAVEVSRSEMVVPGGRLASLEETKDSAYVRLADRLDGIFLDTTRPLSDLTREILSFEGLRSDCLKSGWTAFHLKSPHTPFLLDELQRAFSVAVHDRSGFPALIEVHHDGELLLVCQEAVARDAMDRAIRSVSGALRMDLRVDTNPRGSRDILDGGSSVEDLVRAFETDTREAAKALYVHVDLIVDDGWLGRMEEAFAEVGFSPSFAGIEKFSGKHFQPWSSIREDERRDAILKDAAAIAIALGCTEPTDKLLAAKVPDASTRETELHDLLGLHGQEIPAWLAETAHRGSRQSCLATLVAARSAGLPDLRDAVFAPGGLLDVWLCGDGGDRAGLLDKIGDPGAIFAAAAEEWIEATLSRRFLPSEIDAPFGHCHFTGMPVGKDAAIDSKSGISGLKVSAFSGREGRPESHESAKSQTLVSGFAAAEHRLRSRIAEKTGNGGNDVPAHVSSPTAMGLFATLGLTGDLRSSFLDLNHYDLMRLDLKGDRKVYVDRDQHGPRKTFARHVSMPAKTADLISMVRMMTRSALRLGRPVHVFQGLPSTQAAFVHFDVLPTALRKAFSGGSLRLEQIPDALFLLGIAEALCAKDMQNVGIEVALRILDPDTRFGAACEAVLILDRMPDDKAKTIAGLRANLIRIIRKEYGMQADSPLIDFARAMSRVQAAPRRGASNNEVNLGLRVALETIEGCARIGETSPEAMTNAIAGALEDEFDRSTRLEHRGSFRNLDFPRKAAREAAEVFVTRVWPGPFRGRAPASKDRRIAFAIYQVSFTEESYRSRADGDGKQTDTDISGK